MLRLKIFRRTMKFFDIGANLTDPVFKVRLNSKKFQDLRVVRTQAILFLKSMSERVATGRIQHRTTLNLNDAIFRGFGTF